MTKAVKLRTKFGKTNIYSKKSPDANGRIFVIPGFSESLAHVKPVVDALVAEEFDAFTFSPPRRTPKINGKINPLDRQGEITVEVLKSMLNDGEKVYVIAHSMGAAAALKAAQKHPDYFEGLILMQPAGIVGEQSVSELAKRASQKLVNNQKIARQSKNNSLKRVVNTRFVNSAIIAKQPFLAWRELIATGHYDIQTDLRRVAEMGIPTHIVVSKYDEIFDHAKVELLFRPTIEKIVRSYTVLKEPVSNHDTFWIHPETTAEITKQKIHL